MPAVTRLLTLIAMLLLPFGMAAAPAVPAEAHHASAPVPGEHFPVEPHDTSSGALGHHCAMPCSAALPAADLFALAPKAVVRSPAESTGPPPLAGLDVETATPPPKPS